MATYEFYKISPERRESEAPLPPSPLSIPGSSYSAYRPPSTQRDEPSPIARSENPSSFFDEPSLGHERLDNRFYGAGGGGTANGSNNFSDNIPLRPQGEPVSPISQRNGQEEDKSLPPPATERRRRRRRDDPQRKKGWRGFFSGRVPWVVYTLTLIQVTVFIVEIVKNCTSALPILSNTY
jgi:hypothetical protein